MWRLKIFDVGNAKGQPRRTRPLPESILHQLADSCDVSSDLSERTRETHFITE